MEKVFVIIYTILALISVVGGLWFIGKPRVPTTPTTYLVQTIVSIIVVVLLLRAYV